MTMKNKFKNLKDSDRRKIMKIMIVKEVKVKGIYEELISDCAPSWGTYEQNIEVTWKPGKAFPVNSIKDGCSWYETDDNFGMSSISGETRYFIPVEEFIHKRIAVVLTDDAYDIYLDLENQKKKLNKSIYKEQQMLDYAEIDIDEIKESINAETHISQKRYEELSARIISSTRDVINHSAKLTNLMSAMNELNRKYKTFMNMVFHGYYVKPLG